MRATTAQFHHHAEEIQTCDRCFENASDSVSVAVRDQSASRKCCFVSRVLKKRGEASLRNRPQPSPGCSAAQRLLAVQDGQNAFAPSFPALRAERSE